MTDATLHHFRAIADAMQPNQSWQWIGPHLSQRMFGISQARATAYAAKHGGEAKPLAPITDASQARREFQMAGLDYHASRMR